MAWLVTIVRRIVLPEAVLTERTGPEPGARQRGGLFSRPYRLQLPLDVVGLALMAAAAAQLGDPDVLLHVVWVVLALEAFLFGAATAGIRIAVASVFVVGYAIAADGSSTPLAASLADLDFAEWPLMAAIAVIVAVLADRVTDTGRRYAALYRRASDRLITAQEDERKHLAADLHDGVGQAITALGLTLDAAETALRAGDRPDEALETIRRARALTASTLEDVRAVAFRLRPARLQETGLVAALAELAAAAGIPVAFSAEPELVRPGLVDEAREVDAYRIAQEALGNAARHARASHVTLHVARVDRRLRIEVTDDGIGFDPRLVDARGLGLAGMRDRATAIGATLTVRGRPGRGTLVRLDVPLARGAQPVPQTAAAVAAAEGPAA
jgi:signal transduction histidine kinase